MMRNRLLWLPGALVWLAVVSPACAAPKAAPTAIEFNRDIRPILSDTCFKCHGPDDKERKARLRFDRKEDALKPAKSGDLAIVPGDVQKSALIARITSKDPDELMPPAKSGKKLSAAQIDLLTRWIAQGAQWQEHWAFSKPERPAVPVVSRSVISESVISGRKGNAKRTGSLNTDSLITVPSNPIDAFVLAKLEREKLAPSPAADKPTLARRAALDLTGLPPTPQEVDAFLADESPEAYGKLVDRLLESPRYGEHQARYWLDAARYADSHGYHIDSERSMWKWREWVVDAFNRNMPYDQFTVEQLAGDLLPEPTVEQKIASGFVRCNMSSGEGGAIVEEYQAKYTFDRVETSSTIWLGLTLTCARCHTHKYDPIQHREYYGLYAFFNNLNESVMDGNRPNPDPFMKLPAAEQTRRRGELKELSSAGQTNLDLPRPELDRAEVAWTKQWNEKLSEGWTTLAPASVKSTGGAQFKTLDDQSVLAEGPNPDSDVHEVTVKLAADSIAALRLEALPDDSLPNKGSARAEDGAFRLSEFEAEIVAPAKPDADGKAVEAKPKKLKFTQSAADSAVAERDIAKALDGKAETGWQPDTSNDPHVALFALETPMKVAKGAELRVRLRYEASKSKRAIGRFRLAAAENDELVRLLNPPKFDPWRVVGPFKTENLRQGFTNSFAPETEIDLAKKYPGVREEIKWDEKTAFEDGKNNLLVTDLHGVHGAYYLYRVIKAPAARKLELSVRADDALKLWVNGLLVVERAEEKPGDGLMRVSVDLKKGENKFLLKVVTVQGAAHFTFNHELNDAESVPADIATILATAKKPSGAQQTKVRNYFRRSHSPEFKKVFDDVAKWREEDEAIEKAIPTTMVAKEMDKPRDTFMLVRGEYDKKGDKVGPGVPSILPPLPKDAPTNRLGLAQWLVDPAHPLTARVTVNRFWQQYFGVGLVKTTEDFGVQGEHPSHPELLDWLATEFIRTGWDVKKLQKLIVTSATYRQSARVTPQLLARDPENRLLARGPRFRADAEVVRDTALAVSGLLIEQRGGKSVKPYEPPGLWEAVSFNNSQKYVPDTGEGQYRRSLYTYWKRQSPPPNMLLFDAPSREYCSVRRSRSNTPLQALALLNDPQFVEASRAFAQRIMLEGGKDAASRVAYAFRLATARKPGADETKVLVGVFNQQLDGFRKNKTAAEKLLAVGAFKADAKLDASELAAWTTIASMILNLDETVTKG